MPTFFELLRKYDKSSLSNEQVADAIINDPAMETTWKSVVRSLVVDEVRRTRRVPVRRAERRVDSGLKSLPRSIRSFKRGDGTVRARNRRLELAQSELRHLCGSMIQIVPGQQPKDAEFVTVGEWKESEAFLTQQIAADMKTRNSRKNVATTLTMFGADTIHELLNLRLQSAA